jgi:hypothetical protein
MMIYSIETGTKQQTKYTAELVEHHLARRRELTLIAPSGRSHDGHSAHPTRSTYLPSPSLETSSVRGVYIQNEALFRSVMKRSFELSPRGMNLSVEVSIHATFRFP